MARALRLVIAASLLAAVLYLVGALLRPLPAAVDRDPPVRARILDRERRLLRLAARPGAGDCARAPLLTPGTLPERIVHATLAAEDHRFFRHPGFDPAGIARAALANLRARRLVAGGSTITQQLAGLIEPRPRTIHGKLAELDLAIRLELALEKEEILARYLNRAPYGNGCLGVTAAAEHYFARTPAQLSAAEAALLAALPRAPSTLDPRRHPAEARARARLILRRMHELGWLTGEEFGRAIADSLHLAARPAPFAAPHAVDWALRALPERCASAELTIDGELTTVLEGVLAEALAPHRTDDVEPHGAIVALDHQSGDILALVGSRSYGDPDGGQWNAALAPRQPGSALKPFTYALAFADGATPADLVADIPIAFHSLAGDYLPRNFSQTFHGPVRLREALASSYNVSALRVLDEIGPPRLLALLHAAGISTLRDPAATYGLGLTLGVGEVTLLDLCRAYALFPRGGRTLPVTLFGGASDRLGRAIPIAPVPGAAGPRRALLAERVLPERAAFWVTDILADPDARIPAFGAHGPLALPFPVAAKTGTSSDFRDAWTVGFDHRTVIGVWVGNLEGEPLPRLSGARIAAPLFRQAWYALREWEADPRRSSGDDDAQEALAGGLPGPPSGLLERWICALSGEAPGPGCTEQLREWLPAGMALAPCRFHDRGTGGTIAVTLPAEYDPWLRRAGWEAGTERGTNGLVIESPRDGERFFLAPDLPREVQTIALRASGSVGAISWQVDATPIGTGGELRWPLRAGAHTIRAHSGDARSAPVTIEVIDLTQHDEPAARAKERASPGSS